MTRIKTTPIPKNIDIFKVLSKINATDSCWHWLGTIESQGYGVFSVKNEKINKRQNIKAHRYIFSVFNSRLKSGYVIDHICKNRDCVNPNHLRQVTVYENNVTYSSSPIAKNKFKTHCIRGHHLHGENVGGVGYRYCMTCKRDSNAKYRAKVRGNVL